MIDHPDHVNTVDLSRRLRFALEAGNGGRIAFDEVREDELDGHRHTQGQVLGPPNAAHSAFGQRLEQPNMLGDHLARFQRHATAYSSALAPLRLQEEHLDHRYLKKIIWLGL